jgi:nitrogenase subunit NifH
LVVESVRQLNVPFAVVANRVGERNNLLRAFCQQQGIDLLSEIPESEELARSYARGRIAAEAIPDLRLTFDELWSAILNKVTNQDRQPGIKSTRAATPAGNQQVTAEASLTLRPWLALKGITQA